MPFIVYSFFAICFECLLLLAAAGKVKCEKFPEIFRFSRENSIPDMG